MNTQNSHLYNNLVESWKERCKNFTLISMRSILLVLCSTNDFIAIAIGGDNWCAFTKYSHVGIAKRDLELMRQWEIDLFWCYYYCFMNRCSLTARNFALIAIIGWFTFAPKRILYSSSYIYRVKHKTCHSCLQVVCNLPATC